jgi:hypothetical protein
VIDGLKANGSLDEDSWAAEGQHIRFARLFLYLGSLKKESTTPMRLNLRRFL